jgi:Immunity protein 27
MAVEATALGPEETRLVGQWVQVQGTPQADAVAKRIEFLVRDSLVRVGVTADGWDTLYRDPLDGRFWELSYLQSELHGGGPPRLAVIAAPDAAQKYGVVVPSNTSLERTRDG